MFYFFLMDFVSYIYIYKKKKNKGISDRSFRIS